MYSFRISFWQVKHAIDVCILNKIQLNSWIDFNKVFLFSNELYFPFHSLVMCTTNNSYQKKLLLKLWLTAVEYIYSGEKKCYRIYFSPIVFEWTIWQILFGFKFCKMQTLHKRLMKFLVSEKVFFLAKILNLKASMYIFLW